MKALGIYIARNILVAIYWKNILHH